MISYCILIFLFFCINWFIIYFLNKISSGAIDVAQENLEYLIRMCLFKLKQPQIFQTPNDETFYSQLVELQQKAIADILKELIKLVIFN